MSNNQPIGIFDSGVGGLTVVKEIIKQLPYENLVYLGDTARVPYGTRDNETIKSFGDELVLFMLKHRVKAIVVACNTLSAVALSSIKKSAGNIPVIDVISPTVSEISEDKYADVLGVIGTRATINSRAFQAQIKSKNEAKKVFCVTGPQFVPIVEEGKINDKSTEVIVKKYLSFFDDKDIDVLVLACTHYPFLMEIIRKTLRRKITIVDPAIPTTKFLKEFLLANDLLNEENIIPTRKFYVTKNPESADKTAQIFFKGVFHEKFIRTDLGV